MLLKKIGKNKSWSNNRAIKGSRFWIQTIVNGDLKCLDKKQTLSEIIGENISWKSPLVSENYKEYQLRNINEEYKDISSEFWTDTRGKHPEWDAIGYGDSETLYIVEATSYAGEGKIKAMDRDVNRESIVKALKNTHKELGAINEFNEKIWLEEYFQLTNRIAFWHNFNKAGVKTKLIYLNIVNDPTDPDKKESYPTSQEEWESYYKKASMDLFGFDNSIFEEILYYFLV